MNVTHTEEGDEFGSISEYPEDVVFFGNGDIRAHVHETDDGLQIYVHDHGTINIRGTKKDRVYIDVEPDEFPTTIAVAQREGGDYRPVVES